MVYNKIIEFASASGYVCEFFSVRSFYDYIRPFSLNCRLVNRKLDIQVKLGDLADPNAKWRKMYAILNSDRNLVVNFHPVLSNFV